MLSSCFPLAFLLLSSCFPLSQSSFRFHDSFIFYCVGINTFQIHDFFMNCLACAFHYFFGTEGVLLTLFSFSPQLFWRVRGRFAPKFSLSLFFSSKGRYHLPKGKDGLAKTERREAGTSHFQENYPKMLLFSRFLFRRFQGYEIPTCKRCLFYVEFLHIPM